MRVWIAACLAATVLAAPAVVQAHAPGLKIVGPEKLSVTLKDGSASKSVWVRNTTSDPVTPTFTADLETSKGTVAKLTPTIVNGGVVQSNAVARYRLKFGEGDNVEKGASGRLVASVAGGKGAPGTIELTVAKPEQKKDNGVTFALLIPILPALIIVLTVALIVRYDEGYDWDLPLPSDLDFKDSFASVATGAGAIFGTILAAGVLPEDISGISKEGFAALNLVFGVGVVVASLVFAAFQQPEWVAIDGASPPSQKREMQGTVRGFVVASLVTMWAVFGELYVLWRLLEDIGSDQGFSELAMGFLRFAVGATVVLLLVYVVRRTPAIIGKPSRITPGTVIAAEAAPLSPAPVPPRTRISLF